jgi:Radical SAM superfamily/Iron-sulfur cluster-binding domain
MPTLEFTLMVGCPLKCTFCPQDTLRGIYGENTKYLALDDFKKIVAKVPKHVRIDFSGMAEPWANPDATAMLRHVLELGFNVAIYSTLYDMSAEDGPVVIDLLRRHAAQVEVVCIHLPDRNGNMRGWRYRPEYEFNLRGFLELAETGVLRQFEVVTMDTERRVHAELDHMGIEMRHWDPHTRAGNVPLEAVSGQAIAPMPEHHTAVSCSFTPFYDHNVCLPNGDVVLCCMDYSLKHKVGNLLEQDYYEMFAGPGLARLVAANMTPGFSRESLCKTCDRAKIHRVGPQKQFWQ